MKDLAKILGKTETELMHIELQKSGANQKSYRCEKFCPDVLLLHFLNRIER